MSNPAHPGLTSLPQGPSDDAPLADIEALLGGYRHSTDIRPSGELTSRIRHRIESEPSWTPPRRFMAALRGLHGRGIWYGFSQSARAIFSPGTRTMLLRMQALAVVLVVASSVAFGSVAAIAAASRVITEVRRPAAVEPRPAPPRRDEHSVTLTPVDTDASAQQDGQGDGRAVGLEGKANAKARSAPNGKANAKARSAPNGKANAKAGSAPNGKANAKAGSAPKPGSAATSQGQGKRADGKPPKD